MIYKQLLFIVTFSILLISCTTGAGAPAAIEAYVRALADKDVITAAGASCLAWEEAAFAEASSFEAVEVEIEGLSCQESGTEGEFTRVGCEGVIVANYGGELQDIDLSLRTYLAIREGGEWKMCGYAGN